MTSSSLSLSMFLFFAAFISLVACHSTMRCAKYDIVTGNCMAAIRDEGVQFLQEAYILGSGPSGLCQSSWTNPISSSYSNGSGCPDYAECPDPMGSYVPGESFTIMWWARNHAEADEDPATVFLYLSPIETANQGQDTTEAVFKQNLICSGPYMNCNGTNGNEVPCTLACTMPSNLASGIYTLWWEWPWQGTTYSTCADINVASSSGSNPVPVPNPPAHPVTTSKPVVNTPATTSRVSPITSGHSVNVAQTTGKPAAQTTGKPVAQTTGHAVVQSTSSSSSSPSSPSSTSSSSSSASSSCVTGNMKCATSGTYQTCAHSVWGPIQPCSSGTTCHPSGNYIYCY